MAAQHFILATAGHVDHGKSALVKALTGIDPDRLPEEKARGITIDLGFANLELPAPPAAAAWPLAPVPSSFSVGLIDVPGHEDFVKNMVAGVGSIDLALLVVAADDGWMPQTEEHLQILAYLGVTRAVVALTKGDLLEAGEPAAEPQRPGGGEGEPTANPSVNEGLISSPTALARIEAVRAHLQGSPFAQAPIVLTSTLTGRGLDELTSTLSQILANTPAPRDLGKPRLPVDRVFTLRGIGTVVTGTLTGGALRRGQPVVIQPSGRTARIRALQSHNRDLEVIGPGTRTALNLPDVPAEAVHRGDIITLADLGFPSDTVDVLLEKSPRLVKAQGPAARPLRAGTLIHLHHGSAHSRARVLLLDRLALDAGARALAQLRFEAPVFLFAGDRFIVRDAAEQHTLAGGVVLEPQASRRFWRTGPHRLLLAQRAQAAHEVHVFTVTQLARDHVVDRSSLLLQSRFGDDEVSEAVRRLVEHGQAVTVDHLVADAGWWQDLCGQASDLIQSEHRAHPERLGLGLPELRRALAGLFRVNGTFEALLTELGRHGVERAGAVLRQAAHRPALPPRLEAAGTRLRTALSARPFEPPTRQDLLGEAAAREALQFLLETGEAVEIGDETVMLTEHFTRATEVIREHLRAHGSATVSALRQALGTSRRVMVPLLERLDRDGVTLRRGDQRVLRPPPAQVGRAP